MSSVMGLGENLRECRTKLKLSEDQVARAVGLKTPASISNYENGSQTPPAEILIKLADLYHISTDYLLGVDPRKTINVDGLSPEQIAYLEQGAALFRDSK